VKSAYPDQSTRSRLSASWRERRFLNDSLQIYHRLQIATSARPPPPLDVTGYGNIDLNIGLCRRCFQPSSTAPCRKIGQLTAVELITDIALGRENPGIGL